MASTETKLRHVRKAAVQLRTSSLESRNAVLVSLEQALRDETRSILRANTRDLANLPSTASNAFRDRLLLNEARLTAVRESLTTIASLPDPLGEAQEEFRTFNSLRLRRISSPLGVIFMIFESRPNVAVEAFSLALKSGNAIILRGGKESHGTTLEIFRIMKKTLASNGFLSDSVWGISDPDRSLVRHLLGASRWIDVVVPRGGAKLINFVVKHATMPIIKNDRGMCHIYVDDDADLTMAEKIVFNAKTERPGVCNAMETLLVHHRSARKFLPQLYERLIPKGVTWYGCPNTIRILGRRPKLHQATEKNWDTEYLDLIMNCRIVKSIDEAIAHIEEHGSHHSEAIITRTECHARKFQNEVDAAVVYWNASTRFTDGFEFGLGGELGISTQKLHVRGPVGLKALTSTRWIVDGTGQARNAP